MTNLLSDPQSIFLIFKIGDSFKLVDSLTPNGKLITLKVGKRGSTYVSEVQDNIDRDQNRLLSMSIKDVYKGSYNDIQEQDLVISAWKYGRWSVNTFCGEVRVPLKKVIVDNVNRSDVIKVKIEGKIKSSLRVNYRCYFQEIWNYKLKFSDFKVTNLQHNNGKPYSSQVEFALSDKGAFAFGTSVKTDTKPNDKNPLWETIKGEIKFKGALYELEDQDMTITIKDSSGLKKGPVSVNRISLKGISTKGSVRVPVKVTLSSAAVGKTDVRGTKVPSKTRDTAVTVPGKKDDDQLLAMDFYYTYLEGRISIEEKPKYYQKGDTLILRAGGKYLCVQIASLDNLMVPENVGIVNTFVTCHWGNQRNSTRTIFDSYKPIFNEEMYFKISLDKDEKDPKFYEELKSNLKSKAEITCYVWLDLQNGTCENIGYCSCSLSELNGQLGEEKSFYDFENKKLVKKICRVATIKKRVVSSMIENSNTSLNFSFYMMPDYAPDKLDVSDLTKVEGDKIDPLVYKAIREGHKSEPYKTHMAVVTFNQVHTKCIQRRTRSLQRAELQLHLCHRPVWHNPLPADLHRHIHDGLQPTSSSTMYFGISPQTS